MPKIIQRAAKALYDIFNSEVYRPLFDHSKTDKAANIYFGVPYDKLRDALESGRADFSDGCEISGYGKVSADNFVVAYCHCMMKGHAFATRSCLKLSKAVLTKAIEKASCVLFIDVGCGPGTSGLAFAEIFPNTPFLYTGIDSSSAMRSKCQKMIAAGKLNGLVSPKTKVECLASWNDIHSSEYVDKAVIILNFSYFFASKSLEDEMKSLIAYVSDLIEENPTSRIFIVYTNSINPLAARNYKTFIEGLRFEYDKPNERTVDYYTTAYGTKTNDTTFAYEVFEVPR